MGNEAVFFRPAPLPLSVPRPSHALHQRAVLAALGPPRPISGAHVSPTSLSRSRLFSSRALAALGAAAVSRPPPTRRPCRARPLVALLHRLQTHRPCRPCSVLREFCGRLSARRPRRSRSALRALAPLTHRSRRSRSVGEVCPFPSAPSPLSLFSFPKSCNGRPQTPALPRPVSPLSLTLAGALALTLTLTPYPNRRP